MVSYFLGYIIHGFYLVTINNKTIFMLVILLKFFKK